MTEPTTDPVELAWMAALVDQDNERVFPDMPKPKPAVTIYENERQGNYEQDAI